MNGLEFPRFFRVACHTNNVGPGSTFVVIKGMREDGLTYIISALRAGATTIVVEHDTVLCKEIIDNIISYKATLKRVSNARQALAQLSAEAYAYPARAVKIIAVTGTKGKTTTTFLIEHILRCAGYKTALLSTVQNRILSTILPTVLTTQQPDYLHAFLDQCVQQGVEWVVMEVAAQAFTLHRVHGIMFDAGVFTNFSQEHAEFYANLDTYFAAKQQLLHHLKPHAPLIINGDDARVASLRLLYDNSISVMHSSSESTIQHIAFEVTGSDLAGLRMTFDGWPIHAPTLMGAFNGYNAAMAIATTRALGVTFDQTVQALATFAHVPGRLARYTLPNGATGFIDYAHTPSSYEAVLSMVRQLTDHLIVVFGAGGDRDATKRPIMGTIAAHYADMIVLTTDNPRSEDAAHIIDQIKKGISENQLSKVAVELDREKAIKWAYSQSRPSSVIICLGKGPDEYQLVKGIKLFFSEAQILQAL